MEIIETPVKRVLLYLWPFQFEFGKTEGILESVRGAVLVLTCIQCGNIVPPTPLHQPVTKTASEQDHSEHCKHTQCDLYYNSCQTHARQIFTIFKFSGGKHLTPGLNYDE